MKPFTIIAPRTASGLDLTMSTEFAAIFLFVLIAIGIGLSMLIASALLGPRKVTRVKQMPYESGMNPFGDARQRFDVRYYLIAIVFLLFDVELLFLYPWAVAQWSATELAAAVPTGALQRAWRAFHPIFVRWSSGISSSSSCFWRRRSPTRGRRGFSKWR